MRWDQLREHNGSVSDAFEELCCLLAAHVPIRDERLRTGWRFDRIGRPDAGKECCWTSPKGEQEMWQAKWFPAGLGAAQWAQVNESVTRAIEQHPGLTTMTVCINHDLPDPKGIGPKGRPRTTALDRWNELVESWTALSSRVNGRPLGVEYWGTSALFDQMNERRHVGRRRYFFDREVFAPGWFPAHIAEQVANADTRYTPAVHVPTPTLIDALDLVSLTPAGVSRFRRAAAELCAAHDAFKRAADRAAVDADTQRAFSTVRQGTCDLLGQLSRTDATVVPSTDDRLTEKFQAANLQLDHVLGSGGKPPPPDSPLSHLAYARRRFNAEFDKVLSLVASPEGTSTQARALLLTGRGGAGKTHLACHVAEVRVAAGQPTLLLLGQQHDAAHPWPQIISKTGLAFSSRDEFLGALDAAGELAGCRSLILFDALNEVGDDPARWQNELPGIIAAIQPYPHVAIVFGIRTTYVEAIVPSGLDGKRLPRVDHNGFAANTYVAVRTYFDHYNIRLPDALLLQPEFADPLFLKVFCIATAGEPDPSHRRPVAVVGVGVSGVSVIFDAFVTNVENRLIATLQLNTDACPHPIDWAVTLVAEAMAARAVTHLPRQEAADIIKRVIEGRGPGAGRPLQQLVSAGVLSFDRHYTEEGGTFAAHEVVRFNYDRFASHRVAAVLLSQELALESGTTRLKPDGSLQKLLTDRKFWGQGYNIIEALLIQVPEKCGRELWDLAPEAADLFHAREMFIDSLPWRRDASISDATVSQLGRCMSKLTPDLIDRYFGAMLTMAVRPGHRLNAEHLNRTLSRWRMPARDVMWTARMPNWDHEGSPVRRLVDWALRHTDTSPTDPTVCRLGAIVLAWCCATTIVSLRDRVTKGLVALLQDHLGVAAEIVGMFCEVDDPYVVERVLAAAYGASMRSDDLAGLRGMAKQVYESVFADGKPPAQLLVRDSARGVVELAAQRGVADGIDMSLVRPPYTSTWVRSVPTLAALERRKDRTPESRGLDHLWLSATGHHGLGDFGIYVIGKDRWDGWHPRSKPRPFVTKGHKTNCKASRRLEFAPDLPHRFVFHRAVQMGWTPARFEGFDTQQGWVGRGRPGVERIGKKYQWIALREFLARVDDRYVRYENWDGWQEHVRPWDYSYAGRDLDPSVLKESPEQDDEITESQQVEPAASWCSPKGFTFDPAIEGEAWLRGTGDLPPVEPLLCHTDSDGTEWITLSRITESRWRSDVAGRRVDREAHYILDGYLVRQEHAAAVVEWAEAQELYNDPLPRTPAFHRVYWGELWWAAAARETSDPIVPQWVSGDRRAPHPVLLTGRTYEWEGSQQSVGGAVHLRVPDAWLATQLRVRPTRQPGLFATVDGRATVLDPSGNGSGPPALLVRRDALRELLEREKLSLVWTLLGEKNVYHREDGRDSDTGRLIIRGAYSLSSNGISGRCQARFRDWAVTSDPTDPTTL